MHNPFTITVVADRHDTHVVLPPLPDVGQHPMIAMAYLLAHCTILTFDGICRRQRHHVTQYRCTITAQQRVAHPQIYESITLRMQVHGNQVHDGRLRHGFHLIPKYCPVHATLAATCPIHHELVDPEHEAHERTN